MRVYACDSTEFDDVKVVLYGSAERAAKELGDGQAFGRIDNGSLYYMELEQERVVEYLQEMAPQVIGQADLCVTTWRGGIQVYAVEAEE